jgi:hypothetical protein
MLIWFALPHHLAVQYRTDRSTKPLISGAFLFQHHPKQSYQNHHNPRIIWVTFWVTQNPNGIRLAAMTRKPLTSAIQAEKAKPEAKPYKLAAGEGLFLEILPTGKKRWRLRYFYMGKEQMLSLGMYPYIGLQDAKLLRHNAKQLLAQGKNPSAERKAEKAAKRIALSSTFETCAQDIAQHLLKQHPDKTKPKIWREISKDQINLDILETADGDIEYYRDGEELFFNMDGQEEQKITQKHFFNTYLVKKNKSK